jgi:hypothetical protein
LLRCEPEPVVLPALRVREPVPGELSRMGHVRGGREQTRMDALADPGGAATISTARPAARRSCARGALNKLPRPSACRVVPVFDLQPVDTGLVGIRQTLGDDALEASVRPQRLHCRSRKAGVLGGAVQALGAAAALRRADGQRGSSWRKRHRHGRG